MKKAKILFTLTTILALGLTSCASLFDYVLRNQEHNLELLQNNSTYSEPTDPLKFTVSINHERTAEIQQYFNSQGLDLEAIKAESKTTWQKSVDIATWVTQHVKHSNPKNYPRIRNSIDLYEWALQNPRGFNCRMHSILLGELFTAAGIQNRFITCNPYDDDDNDCHVVNIVWLPELNKWAMIDSDMDEYTIDSEGIPLSLQEMREEIIKGNKLNFNSLTGSTLDTKYLQAYWTKNLFWFDCHSVYGYSLEDYTAEEYPQDKYYVLLPSTMPAINNGDNVVRTNDDDAFWAAPPPQLAD